MLTLYWSSFKAQPQPYSITQLEGCGKVWEMMCLTNSLISRDDSVWHYKKGWLEDCAISFMSAEVTFLTLLNRNSITDLAFLMVTLLLYTCEFQTSVKRCKLADAGMRNKLVCVHLFLNPLFDMVKCLPILRRKPSFPVLLITNALLAGVSLTCWTAFFFLY